MQLGLEENLTSRVTGFYISEENDCIDHVQISILDSLEIRKLHCLYLEHAISIILIDLLEVKNNFAGVHQVTDKSIS